MLLVCIVGYSIKFGFREATKTNKDDFKNCQLTGEEQDHEQYKVKKKESKKVPKRTRMKCCVRNLTQEKEHTLSTHWPKR